MTTKKTSKSKSKSKKPTDKKELHMSELEEVKPEIVEEAKPENVEDMKHSYVRLNCPVPIWAKTIDAGVLLVSEVGGIHIIKGAMLYQNSENGGWEIS